MGIPGPGINWASVLPSSGYQVLPSCQGLRDQPGARTSRAACQAAPTGSSARARALLTSPELHTAQSQEGKSHPSSTSLSRHWGCCRADPEALNARQEKRRTAEAQTGSRTPPAGHREEEGAPSTSTLKCLALKCRAAPGPLGAWPREGGFPLA